MKRNRKLQVLGNGLLGILSITLILGIGIPAAHAKEKKNIKVIQGLVAVKDVDPTIAIDLRYATEDNFTGKKVYPYAIAILRRETAEKLAIANKKFHDDGYGLKIWDAYRPPSVQKIFWELVPDERYVADPAKEGSRHNRGGAVDVTLVDSFGREVPMPTKFDDFTEQASVHSVMVSAEAKTNANYLAKVMTQSGFDIYEHEWWHFDDRNWKDFPLVDVAFDEFLNDLSGVPVVLQKLNPSIKQAVIVRTKSADSSRVVLEAWEFKDGWKQVYKDWSAVIGKNGLAPAGQKKEGDGRTPSGVYKLGSAFGYEPAINTKLVYRQATDNDFWVDDPASKQYNQWVTGTPEAKSFERMKRDDGLYKYGAVIEYNTDTVVPGAGSAIFLHVWRGSRKPTSGCVALPEANLLKLLAWLDVSRQPVIVLGN